MSFVRPILPRTLDVGGHPFHVLTSSKLPIFMSIFVGSLATTFVAKLHDVSFITSNEFSGVANQLFAPFFSVAGYDMISFDKIILVFLGCVVAIMGSWSYNLVIESSAMGHHTKRVQSALMYGMLLFLISELMLFFPFFGSFFHGALAPSVAIGGVWPPVGIKEV